jgi:Ser/Thr protein kinase RdoA (MazF antagonist)
VTAERCRAALALPDEPLTLLRLGENALFRAGGTDLLLRVARPGTAVDEVARTMTVARTLRARGVPVGEPADDAGGGNPVVLDGVVVSLWRYYRERADRRIDYAAFGRILRTFHDVGAGLSGGVPPWDVFPVTRRRLRAAARTGAPGAWLDRLSTLADRLEGELAEFRPVLPAGVIHGDSYSGNLLDTDGGLVLIDLDNVSVGPREVDFAPTVVQLRRFGLPESNWRQLTGAYGLDDAAALLDSPMVRLREVYMTAWLIQQFGNDVSVDRELELRVGSLDEQPGRLTPWTAR